MKTGSSPWNRLPREGEKVAVLFSLSHLITDQEVETRRLTAGRSKQESCAVRRLLMGTLLVAGHM